MVNKISCERRINLLVRFFIDFLDPPGCVDLAIFEWASGRISDWWNWAREIVGIAFHLALFNFVPTIFFLDPVLIHHGTLIPSEWIG